MNGMLMGGMAGMDGMTAKEAVGGMSGMGRDLDVQCGPKSPVQAEIVLLYEQLRDLGHTLQTLEKMLTPVITMGPSTADKLTETNVLGNRDNPPPRGSSPVVVELRGLRNEMAGMAQLVRALHQQIEV